MIRWLIALIVRSLHQTREIAAWLEFVREIPAPATGVPLEWTQDDSQALAAFLESETGSRFRAHLAHRLRDYETAAVTLGTTGTTTLLCKRAHGFRDAIVEVRRLSAAGPRSRNTVATAFPVPPDLENLRGD